MNMGHSLENPNEGILIVKTRHYGFEPHPDVIVDVIPLLLSGEG